MSEKDQAREWVRNVQLAHAHFGAFKTLDEAYGKIQSLYTAQGSFLLLAYQAHRNSVIIHIAAAMDRAAGAISIRKLIGEDLAGLALLRALEIGGVPKRIEFVRNKTIGHRSSTHSNSAAWAAAGLRAEELEDMLSKLDQLKDIIATRAGILPYVTAQGSATGLIDIIAAALDMRDD